jgi:spore germination protein YaaH
MATTMLIVALATMQSSAPARAEAPQSVRAAAASPNLSREVFGFALASSLADSSVGYPSWNFSLLSTVAFFSLHVGSNGSIAQDSSWNVWNSSALSGLLGEAHAHGARVVVTIDMQDFTPGNAGMCAALTNRSTTVQQTVAQVIGKGVDGVNVDYEGLNGTCPNGTTTRSMLVALVQQLRAAIPAGAQLSVDTYASSAADPIGFFDIGAINPYVDAFFVMAYDLEYSNWHRTPPACATFCLGPTAPLAGYYYSDASTADQYASVAGASKVILGVPYYGRKACVAGAAPNAVPTGPVTADSYLTAVSESSATEVQSYTQHRDGNDPSGQERWDTWYNTTLKCTRELYWDDAASLARKYDLINQKSLRGVGIWNLNYGGGATELWQLLATKFGATWSSLGGTATSRPAVSSSSAARLDVFVRGQDNAVWQDTWTGSGWSGWVSLGGSVTSAPAAVSWGSSRIDLFAIGQDKALWHRAWTGSGWSPWATLGGVLASGPDVASWGSGRLDVFALGQDRGVWHIAFDSGSWSGWTSLGGALTADPSAVSWGGKRIDVFGRGQDNGLWHKWWNGSAWSGWYPLGGKLGSAPDAASCAPGHLDVFALGAASTLYQLGYDGGWTGWQQAGNQTWTSAPSAACEGGTATDYVLERGTDDATWLTRILAS